jgi:hypothetical protein
MADHWRMVNISSCHTPFLPGEPFEHGPKLLVHGVRFPDLEVAGIPVAALIQGRLHVADRRCGPGVAKD